MKYYNLAKIFKLFSKLSTIGATIVLSSCICPFVWELIFPKNLSWDLWTPIKIKYFLYFFLSALLFGFLEEIFSRLFEGCFGRDHFRAYIRRRRFVIDYMRKKKIQIYKTKLDENPDFDNLDSKTKIKVVKKESVNRWLEVIKYYFIISRI